MDINSYKRNLLSDAFHAYNDKVSLLKKDFIQKVKNSPKNRVIYEKLLAKHTVYVNELTKQYNKQINNIKHLKFISGITNNNTFDTSAKKKGLLIGINYRYSSNKLYGCINDVISMENKLRNTYGFTGFSILTDDTINKPTVHNILVELANIFNTSNDGDTIVIHFSGHGTSGGHLLALDGYIDHNNFTRIICNNLKDNVKVLVILDCCHSSSVMDLKYNFDSVNMNILETKEQIVVLSGCKSNQYSLESYIDRLPQGLMTWSLLESLNTNSKISWRDLIINMQTLLSHSIFPQVPQICSGKKLDFDSEFYL
jgi:metacaspase-1